MTKDPYTQYWWEHRIQRLEAIIADLLAALEALAGYFEPIDVGEAVFSHLPELRKRVEQARAAIAKAKG